MKTPWAAFILLFLLLYPALAMAQMFGNLEQPLPGFEPSIDALIRQPQPTLTYVATIINYITVFIILIGLISIVIGGFLYITAGGEAKKVDQAKTFIKSALTGIVLALAAWLILNTISQQFTSGLKEPRDLLPNAPANPGNPGGGGGGGGPVGPVGKGCKNDADCADGGQGQVCRNIGRDGIGECLPDAAF